MLLNSMKKGGSTNENIVRTNDAESLKKKFTIRGLGNRPFFETAQKFLRSWHKIVLKSRR